MHPLVAVEPVTNAAARRRFVEVPFVLHRDEPRWAPPLQSYERRRIDRRRNPFLRTGEADLFLARRAGVIVGRISAHVAADPAGEGWFGFYDVPDDTDVAAALLDAVKGWLAARGCSSMTGPASFTPATEAGVLVEGGELAGVTGRQWHPPWYAEHLAGAGLSPVPDEEGGRFPAWRVDPASLVQASAGRAVAVGRLEPITGKAGRPTITGPYSDPALVLGGDPGTVAAVPDISAAFREGGALGAARAARRRGFETCVIVVVDGDPAVLVPQVAAAATRSAYRTIVTPWVPPGIDEQPATVHQLFNAHL